MTSKNIPGEGTVCQGHMGRHMESKTDDGCNHQIPGGGGGGEEMMYF